MRIFILTSSLTYGGAERVASLQANGLVKLGYEVFLLTDLRKPVTYQVDSQVKLLDVGVRGNLIALRWRQLRLMYKLIQEYRPDFVVSHLAYGAMAALAARLALGWKRPLVIVADHNSYERPACAPCSGSVSVVRTSVFIFQDVSVKKTKFRNRESGAFETEGYPV